IQKIAYLKRNPSLTRAQFYEHWEKTHGPLVIPFFEKHGVRTYQQIHASGTILSNREGGEHKVIEFDGIALNSWPSDKPFGEVFMDSYYKDVIAPDEGRLLDGQAVGGGIVALFSGVSVGLVEDGRAVVTKEGGGKEG
ncbi:hypothetical protein K469DRAFT_552152, partial [Zopfia rhizophila CBS 207.26]